MLLFPLSYVLHIAEEYWGGEGYVAYLYRLRGVHMSTVRFLVFQSFGVFLISLGLFLSVKMKWPRFMLTILGALVLSNGISHTITAIHDGHYGPGLITSVLWIPLGLVTLFHLFGDMPTLRFIIAASIGVGINVTVALIALRGGKLR